MNKGPLLISTNNTCKNMELFSRPQNVLLKNASLDKRKYVNKIFLFTYRIYSRNDFTNKSCNNTGTDC